MADWKKIVLATGTSTQYIKGDGTFATYTDSLPLVGGTVTGDVIIKNNNGNASQTLLILRNNDNTSNTEKDQTAELEFQFKGTTDSGVSFDTKNAGKIVAGKDSDYFTASADNMDSHLKFYTSQDNVNTLALTIDSSQNVGIGETSPNTKLSLKGSQGAFDFTRGNTNDSHWFFSSDSARLYISETDIQSSNIKVTIDDSGNVGIGTVPTAKLDINISSNARGYFSSTIGEVGSGNFALQAVDSSGANLKPLGFRAEDIRFATGSAERLRINSSGNTEIYGNIEQSINSNGGNLNEFRNTNTGTSAYSEHRIVMGADNTGLRLGSSYNYSNADWNNAWVYAVARDLKLASSNGKMDFYVNGSTASDIALTIATDKEATFADDVRLGISKKIYAQSNSTNSIEFYNGATGAMNFVSGTASYDYPMEFRQNDAQVMTIKSQRVGIGTQSPSDLLDLQDGSNANNAPRIKFGSIDTWRPVQKFYKWAGSSNLFYAWRFRLDSDFQIQTGGSTATTIGGETYTTALTIDSSQNTTFAGTITATSASDNVAKFESSDAIARIVIEDNASENNGNWIAVQNDVMSFATNGSNTALTLDSSQNATFNGGVNLHKTNATGLTSYLSIRPSGTSSVYSGLGLGTANSTLVLYVDKNNAIGSGSALVLQTGGTDALTIDGSQNATFSGEVKSTTNITSNSGGVGKVSLATSGNNAVIDLNNSTPANTVRIHAGGNTFFNGGNVGIGTTSPSYKLHVAGTAFASNLTLSGWSSGDALKLNYGNATGTVEAVSFLANGGTNGNIKMVMASANSGDLILNGANNTNQLTLYRDGNVGIGTTTPSSYHSQAHNLVIYENSNSGMTIASANNASGSIFFADSTTGDEAYKGRIEYNHGTNKLQFGANSVIHTTLDASGNFGIGSSSPSGVLEVNTGSGAMYITRTAGDDGSANPAIAFLTDSAKSRMYSYGDLSFYTTTVGGTISQKMKLDSSGNLGIATTSPKAKLHVVGGTASNGDGVYYYENVAFKDGSSSETGTLKITLPMFNSTTMTKFTIEGYDYSGGARGQSWTVKVGGYMYNNNNWYNYYAHLEGRPPFSSVRLANDGSKNVILLGTTSTTWTYPKIVITEVLAGFNNGDDWGSGYDISWITSETGIGNISTPNIDYRMASNGDSIFSVVKTQDSSDTADYVKMYHDGSDGYLISNRGQLRLSSQSGIDALKIDSSGNVSLSNNLSLTNGSPVMYMSGSSGDHTRFGWAEGDPDVAYWRFYQNGGMTASITMDAFTENTAGGRIEFNSGASEVAIASVDSGGVFLGRNASGQNTTTELGGYGVLASNGTRYGNYGWLTFNAPTNSFTAGARGWAITNGYQANKFALLQSTNANDEPILTTNGEVGTNTTVPLTIDNSGNTTLNGALTVNENALTLEEDIAGNASYVRMNYNMPNSTDDAYGTVGMQRTSSTTYLGMLISSDSRDGIRFSTANGTPVERMRIDASGRVGIGQDNPSYPLHIKNTSDTLGYFKSTDNNAQIAVVDDDTVAYFGANGSRAFMGTASGLAGTTNLVVDSSGKVGIGTTSPSELLTISNSSDTNKTKLAIVGGTKGFTIGKTFQSQSYGHIRPISSGQVMALRLMPNTTDQDTYLELFGHDYETETTNFARGMLVLKQSDGNAFQIISDANGSESVGNIEFVIENGSTPAVVIDTNGRMGIGNSAPDKTLVVQGSGAEAVIADTGTIPTLRFREGGATKGVVRTSSADMQFYTGGSSASNLAMTISSTGRVGIGTSSPSYPGLHISNSTPYLALEDSDGTNQKIDILHSGGGTFFTGRNGNAYGSFVFRGYNGSAYATAVTIDSSQRVGIQESNPTEALHVKGNIKTNGELIGKTYVTFVHNFSDDMGTSAHTIPWTDGNEGPDNSKANTNFVAPYPMSLVKIIVRPTAVQNSGALRVTLKKEDDGDGTNDTVATATPSGNLASNTAKVVTASDFDNTPDIGILDKINIELSTSVDVNTSSTDWFVTTVWTMDVN